MARLASPPTFLRLASGLANSAPGRAPIQSVVSPRTIRASFRARPSPIISAASRTINLRVASAALQVERSARVSTATSRAVPGACTQALRDLAKVRERTTDSEQSDISNKSIKSRIPGPKASDALAKWAKSRWHTSTLPAPAAENEMEYEESEDGDTVIEINNNPELLNDVSFDENLSPSQQRSLPDQFARMKTLMTTRFQGHRVAHCPGYGGADSFVLGRKRPRVKIILSIPRKPKSTLKYGYINKQSTTFSSALRDMTKTFNCFGFGTKPPFHITPELLTDLDIELFLSLIVKSNAGNARPDSGVEVAGLPASATTTALLPTRKTVRFHGGVKRRLFDLDAPANGVNTPLDKRNYDPLMGGAAYPGSSVPIGFDSMFQSTSLQTVALKRRVLHRFKAVQEYEKRRRQAAIAAGDDDPPLGQLDYGNADHKLALQPTKVITIDDIGTFVNPLELGIPRSTYNGGPLLHFGAFEDYFGRVLENGYISERPAAYKLPISWDDAPGSEPALHRWTKAMFCSLQPADLAD